MCGIATASQVDAKHLLAMAAWCPEAARTRQPYGCVCYTNLIYDGLLQSNLTGILHWQLCCSRNPLLYFLRSGADQRFEHIDRISRRRMGPLDGKLPLGHWYITDCEVIV